MIEKTASDSAIDEDILAPIHKEERTKMIKDFVQNNGRRGIDVFGRPLMTYISGEKRTMFAFRFFFK